MPRPRRPEQDGDVAAACVAPSMDDPAARVCRLKTESDLAIGILIESHPELRQPFDPGGRGAKDRRGNLLIAKTISGGEGIRQMQRCVVVRSDTGGNAALRENARCFEPQRRAAQKQHRLWRQRKRGHQAGKAPTDDDGGAIGIMQRRHLTDSIRSTARRARAAMPGSIMTSCCIVSSAWRILPSVIFFMCGHRLHGRMNSRPG